MCLYIVSYHAMEDGYGVKRLYDQPPHTTHTRAGGNHLPPAHTNKYEQTNRERAGGQSKDPEQRASTLRTLNKVQNRRSQLFAARTYYTIRVYG